MPRRPAPGAPSWPAADVFARSNGLSSARARVLLAEFCGLPPDHAYGDPPG